MKFKILEDNSNLSLKKARKEILCARNTKARNKAAMKLSDKLEQAEGFHVGGGLNYRSRARKLLKNLGNVVGHAATRYYKTWEAEGLATDFTCSLHCVYLASGKIS